MFSSVKRRLPLRRAATLLPVALCLVFSPLYAGKKAATSSAALTRMTRDLKYLAADELEGRGVGTKGLNKAADYVRKRFAEAGLNVTAVDGDAFQYFEMSTGTKLGKGNSLTFAGKDGRKIELKLGVDYEPCSFGSSGRVDAGVVFLGYGIHAPEVDYSDYKGADIKGKAVIIMRRSPQQGNPHSPFQGNRRGLYQSLRHKYTEAFNRGAAAILFVNDSYSTKREARRRTKLLADRKDDVVKAAEALEAAEAGRKKDPQKVAAARKRLSAAVKRLQTVREAVSGDVDKLMKFGYGGNAYRGKDQRPIYHISQKACDRLLKASLHKSLAELEAKIDEKLQPATAALSSWTAQGRVSLIPVVEKVKNVIGVLEGEGPLAEETVIVGAHYDHVGYGKYGSRTPGPIHNGADDNASGTTVLIEVARRLAARPKKLPRRVVFIAFTAEELGLVGSQRYVENPVFPLEKTIAMINMDMVGRLRQNKLTVFAVGTSPRWKPLLQKYATNPFTLTMNNYVFPRSDHASFARKRIPTIHFFTNTHADYHRPSDDWEKINFEGMAEVEHLVEKIVVATAETKERPKYTKAPDAPPGRKVTRGRWPYFGTIPDYAAKVDGLRITGTAKGSPAEKAGVKAGDVVVRLDRYKIAGIQDYAYALSQFKAGDTVEVIVKRKGKTVKLKATFVKQR